MVRLFCTSFILLFVGLQSPALFATGNDLPVLEDPFTIKWLHTDHRTGAEEYKRADRHNKKLLRRAVTQYLANSFESIGVSESTFRFTGGAIFFFLKQDAEINLNDSKTMSLEFTDVRDEDRAVIYKIKYNW